MMLSAPVLFSGLAVALYLTNLRDLNCSRRALFSSAAEGM